MTSLAFLHQSQPLHQNEARILHEPTILLKVEKENRKLTNFDFPEEMYDYADISLFLQAHTGLVVPNDKIKGHISILYLNLTIYRVVILMHKDSGLNVA